MGSCELPDASRSLADTRAERDLLALVGTRGPGELRGGVGGSEGWQSPSRLGGTGSQAPQLGLELEQQKAISCLTRGLADEEGTEPLGTLGQLVGGGRERCCPSRNGGCRALGEAAPKNHI